MVVVTFLLLLFCYYYTTTLYESSERAVKIIFGSISLIILSLILVRPILTGLFYGLAWSVVYSIAALIVSSKKKSDEDEARDERISRFDDSKDYTKNILKPLDVAPKQTSYQQPYRSSYTPPVQTVIVEKEVYHNHNNDLVTGIALGSMMNNHHHDSYHHVDHIVEVDHHSHYDDTPSSSSSSSYGTSDYGSSFDSSSSSDYGSSFDSGSSDSGGDF